MENDLKFAGASPVIIDQNGSTDEIYAPISTSSSDITIVSEHILDDLYTPDKDDIQVEISYDRALYNYEYTLVEAGEMTNLPGSVMYQRDLRESGYYTEWRCRHW